MGDAEELGVISDIAGLAAMTQPLRRRLIDLLDLEGPATAGALASRTGLPEGVLVRHLDILASSGLIEEESLPRTDPQPCWRLASAAISVLTSELPDDPVSRTVIGAAHWLTLDRLVGFMRQWMTAREGFDEKWAASGFMTDSWLRLSPTELAELRHEMSELLARWSERIVEDDGQDRHPIFAAAQAIRVLP